ncbi:efflux RND transporter permease subunit [Carboxylicivirga sp. N1Y90]|uniref:efflux RND transporter permease subunit n=1 Tax=Carboxylicivirga fragile TaxID=3417571 RepID=UPI003D336147|nr:efflux RND transporter permease subunit [Marinilabiliaceae bacterium N1Y90]
MKNSFSVNIIFILLSLIGCSLVPLLSIQLLPANTSSHLYVSYYWPDISSEIIEREVTSPLEGVLSSIKGLEEISSSSFKGRAYIKMNFKDGCDLDAIRFEIASLMRHAYSKLPEGVSRPLVSNASQNSTDKQLLITYALNGEGSPLSIQQYAKDYIVPGLGLISDVELAEATGAKPLEWEITYDSKQLNTLSINPDELSQSIIRYYQERDLGGGKYESSSDTVYTFLAFSSNRSEEVNWNEIIVGNYKGRIIRLTDVAKIKLREQDPDSYFRINGLNTIYLNIYAAKGANQIKVANKVYEQIKKVEASFPKNYSLMVSYDASKQLNKELKTIVFRSGLVILILLVFIFLVSRSWRYLLIIGLSLLVNLANAVIFFYSFGIEIHLYSLAGITVSLGIIIDNTIIMADHRRLHKNNKAFLAILAATLTSMGALSIIFFLKKEQQLNLIDFALVMLVNLAVSLFVALFFIPALTDKVELKSNRSTAVIKRRRSINRISTYYGQLILFTYRFKLVFILIVILGFGIPFHLLPDQIESKNKETELSSWEKTYNKTIGNATFVNDVKPWLEKIFGGSFYLFSNYMEENQFDWDNNRTKLTVNISMPDGATLEQMNKVFVDLENYLASFDEIERFISRIRSVDRSSIEISFKKEAEHTTFPYYLKQLLETKAVETGGADFGIFGVGRGFSNKLYEGNHNSSILLTGYNFDDLMGYADFLKKELLKHQRIQEVFIRTEQRFYGKPRYEFVANVNMDRLVQSDFTIGQLYEHLLTLSPKENIIHYVTHDKELLPVVLHPNTKDDAELWSIKNSLLTNENGKSTRFKNVANIEKVRSDASINKLNQQYRIVVTYDFIGPYQLSKRVLDRNVEMINKHLPLGYIAKKDAYAWRWNYDEESQYWLLFLLILIIYIICAILLESLLQPLAVIAMIPISFIGVFLTFTLFKLPFDQGGYASLILICGLTVNSALYIINDYNNNRKSIVYASKIRLYTKAYNHKITPILLTIISSTLGFVPFLLGGRGDGFWFSLAAGAIGGLLFSLLALIIWLPLLLKLVVSNSYKRIRLKPNDNPINEENE